MKLDDQRAMNLKLRKAGFEARGLDEAAICQVSADQTDGFISEVTVLTLARAHGCRYVRRLINRLESVGRWLPTDERGEPGWYIHDYLEYNLSKDEWAALRANKREAGRRGGQASAQARASTESKHDLNPSRPVPLVKGGRGHTSTTRSRPAPDFVGPAADVPIDPLAASKLRAVKNEMAERWGQKK